MERETQREKIVKKLILRKIPLHHNQLCKGTLTGDVGIGRFCVLGLHVERENLKSGAPERPPGLPLQACHSQNESGRGSSADIHLKSFTGD